MRSATDTRARAPTRLHIGGTWPRPQLAGVCTRLLQGCGSARLPSTLRHRAGPQHHVKTTKGMLPIEDSKTSFKGFWRLLSK